MNVLRPGRHDHFRIEVGLEGLAGGHRIDELDAAQLDHAVTGERIKLAIGIARSDARCSIG